MRAYVHRDVHGEDRTPIVQWHLMMEYVRACTPDDELPAVPRYQVHVVLVDPAGVQ